jgi:Ca2+-binding RTX toxin-like protein
MQSRLARLLSLVAVTVLVTAFPGVSSAKSAAPKCFGKTATIVSNAATINGTPGADVIVAGGGNNKINAGNGNDRVCAGGGIDGVKGGGGNDMIDGGAGSDGTPQCVGNVFIDGGAGNDTIKGGSGDNCYKGGAGADKLTGGANDDYMLGGTGSDKLDGGANGNPLTSTALGDTASFRDLPASVTANLSTGTATSGGDTDTLTNMENLFGTSHDDTLVGGGSGAGSTPNGLEGWLGDDTLEGNGGFVQIAAYLFAPGPVTVDMGNPAGGVAGSATGAEGNDTLSHITGVAGSQFADDITGGNILFGGGGADTINAGPSNDTIFADGRGPDPSDGNDVVNAGAGNDTVFGSGGDDDLDGGGGTDNGDGGGGTDTCKNFEHDGAGGGTGPSTCEA